jgi:uncharacterized protein (TIGR03083 family)
MGGAENLDGFIEAWRVATRDASALLRSLDPNDWEKPTDLPGWNVRYVAAHLAHLESELAGLPQEHVDVPESSHIKGLMGQYTEMGPLARAEWSAEQIIDQFEAAVAIRSKALEEELPQDPTTPGPGFAGLIGWSWETLLSNRPFDVWMHEQDIRRAVGRPGNLDSLAAEHVARVFTKSLPYVVAKRAGAPAGTTAVIETTGAQQLILTVTVGEDGRGSLLPDAPADPTVRITLDFESFIVLSGGRRTPTQVDARIKGDDELGHKILANLGVTP